MIVVMQKFVDPTIQHMREVNQATLDRINNEQVLLKDALNFDELFDKLYGSLGSLSKKEQAKRLDLIDNLVNDFNLMLKTSDKFKDKLTTCKTLDFANYTRHGLPAVKANDEFRVHLKYHDKVYQVTVQLRPTFAKKQGSYFTLPIQVHSHERILVQVKSIHEINDPKLFIKSQWTSGGYHQELRQSKLVNDFLNVKNFSKQNFMNINGWVTDLYLMRLWNSQKVNQIEDKFKDNHPLTPALVLQWKLYLACYDLLESGQLFDLKPMGSATTNWLMQTKGVKILDDQFNEVQWKQIKQLVMENKTVQLRIWKREFDLMTMLHDVLGYHKFNWENAQIR